MDACLLSEPTDSNLKGLCLPLSCLDTGESHLNASTHIHRGENS